MNPPANSLLDPLAGTTVVLEDAPADPTWALPPVESKTDPDLTKAGDAACQLMGIALIRAWVGRNR